jgi:hypothetical protein
MEQREVHLTNQRRKTMGEVHTHPQHPASMEQRIADRLKPSAGAGAGDIQITSGNSPNRVVHTIHHCGAQTGGAGKSDEK